MSLPQITRPTLSDFYPWTLADLGLLGVNFPPELISQGSNFTSGRIEYVRVRVPYGGLCTGVVFALDTAGASLTSGQNLLGLYSIPGTKLAETADQTATNFVGSGGQKQAAWSGGPVAIAAGDYFVAVMSNGTTPAKLRRADTFADSNGVLTSPLSALRRLRSTGTGNTALPASVTWSTDTQIGGNNVWVGLY